MEVSLPEEVWCFIFSHLGTQALRCTSCVSSVFRRICGEVAFVQGRERARMRFFEVAIEFLSICLRVDPAHAGAREERAIAFFNMGNRDVALQDLEVSVALAKTECDKNCVLAVLYEMKGQLQKSLECSRRATLLEPSCSRGFFELAYVLHELPFHPNNPGAVEAYTKCLRLGYHREYVVHFNRGWALECSGDYEGAKADYLRCLECNPRFTQASRSLARLNAEDEGALREDIERYKGKLEELRARGEDFSFLHLTMGFNYDVLREDDAAIREFEKALEEGYPRRSLALTSIARIHERAGRHADAIAVYERAALEDPYSTLPLERIARLQYLRGVEVEKVLHIYDAIKKRDKWNMHAYQVTAQIFREQGNRQRAVEELESCFTAFPECENTENLAYLAEILCSGRDYDEKEFERAVECHSRILHFYPSAHVVRKPKMRAHCWVRMGKLELAERDLRKVREEDAADTVARNNLGCVLCCLGRWRDAVPLFQLDELMRDFRSESNLAHALAASGDIRGAEAVFVRLDAMHPGRVGNAINLLRTSPDTFRAMVGPSRLLFCRALHYEHWLSSVTYL